MLDWHEGRAWLGTGWALWDASLALPLGPARRCSAMCRGVEGQETACTAVKIIQRSPLALLCSMEIFLGCYLANKCVSCEIKAKTSLSWYFKNIIGHILLGKRCTLIDVALAGWMQHDNAAFLCLKRNTEKVLAKLWKALLVPQASIEAWLRHTLI